MPDATSPISSNLDQVYAHQLDVKSPSPNEAASVSELIKQADGSVALEIIQSLLPRAFPAVVPGDAGAHANNVVSAAFNPPPEVGNFSEGTPGGTINALG